MKFKSGQAEEEGSWDFVKLVISSEEADIRSRHQHSKLWERSSSTAVILQTQWHTGWHQLNKHIVLRRGANRPLDTNQTPIEACENTRVTRLEATAINSSPTQVEKQMQPNKCQNLPQDSMIRFLFNSAPFKRMFEGKKTTTQQG